MDRRLVICVVFVIAAISLMVCFYWYNLIFLSSPPVEEGSPEILSYVSFVESDSNRYLMIEGEVKNNLRTNAAINLTANFYDEAGNLLGNVTRRALLKILKSGEKSPFILVWVLNSSVIPRYELALSYCRVHEEPPALEVSCDANWTDANGCYVVTGRVWNRGDGNAIIVSVICTYYDSAGNVTLVSISPVPNVDAGCEAFFELSSAPYRISPAGYMLAVVAYRYERPLVQNYVFLVILVLVFAVSVVYLKRRGW
jgi:hypothetical protein